MFLWDICGQSVDGKGEMIQGLMGQIVGIITLAIFNAEDQP